MLRGFLSSSIAGVLIFAELLYLVIFGLNSVFSIISKALMLSIYAVAFPAYINYLMSNLPKKFLMAYLIPIALVIEAFGLYY
ncbi:MAG: hypothetical protein JZD40_03700, partial [Sulfolobus sp.]|nr:hypothetical protein [Sulfolobus sp.]